MGHYCKICGTAAVQNDGDICSKCASGLDPFAVAAASINISQPPLSSSVKPSKRRVLLADKPEPVPPSQPTRKILDASAGGEIDTTAGKISSFAAATLTGASNDLQHNQTSNTHSPAVATSKTSSSSKSSSKSLPSNSSNVLEKGIVKNVVQDTDRRGVVWRWFRTLFSSANFAFDSDITEFQIYPDFSGHTLNASGNLSNQVIIYGKIPYGMIAENNDVEVFGRRGSNGCIVASRVKNIATGATAKPSMTLSRGVVWGITLALVAIIAMILFTWGPGFFVNIFLLIVFILCLPLILKFFAWIIALLVLKAK